jgi:hypothetical protein
LASPREPNDKTQFPDSFHRVWKTTVCWLLPGAPESGDNPHDEMENHFSKEVVSPRTCRKNRINQKWQFSAPFELVCMLMRL